MTATILAECARCSVLVHVPRARAAECPRCAGALAIGGVDVGFHDARAVYGEPGAPWQKPPERQGALLRCADGHKARSRDEKVVDDWMSARGILHEREPKIRGMVPDWRIPAVNVLDERTFTSSRQRGDRCGVPRAVDGDVYVEFWGMAGQQGYEARREEKLAMYRARGLTLIELFPEDVDALEAKLGALAGVPRVGQTRPMP